MAGVGQAGAFRSSIVAEEWKHSLPEIGRERQCVSQQSQGLPRSDCSILLPSADRVWWRG